MPTAWRSSLALIVEALATSQPRLVRTDPRVRPITREFVQTVTHYARNYGETLTTLPEETWRSSVTIGMDSLWEVIVDLWTRESGRSDMILLAKVHESAGDWTIEACAVYVP